MIAETEELFRELRHLRAVFREAGENFILRREGEIEELISRLEGLSPSSRREIAPAWSRELKSLKLKPKKGRLKDLRAVDELIGQMAERVVSAEENEPLPRKK